MKIKKVTVGVFLLNEDNEVLLHLRDNKPSLFMANMWTCLGGSIEENETSEQAAFRELKEEIDFIPKKLSYLVRYTHNDRLVDIFFTHVDIKDPSFLPVNEGICLKFYSFKEIYGLYKDGKTNIDIINQIKILKPAVLKEI